MANTANVHTSHIALVLPLSSFIIIGGQATNISSYSFCCFVYNNYNTTGDEDLDMLFQVTGEAATKWKEIGRVFGFTESELDLIPSMTSLHDNEGYYSVLLSQWLDWSNSEAKPHYFPTLDRMISALRVVGEESLADDLDNLQHTGIAYINNIMHSCS